MATQPALNWDHLRVFLAVMRSGSLRQAADLLGLSHPTIRRRLQALEAQLGLHLFDRRADGLHATPEASALLDHAKQVEASIHALSRSASNASPSMQGWIHVSAPDLLMSELLAPDLAAFAEKWPEIRLRIETSYELADLGSREADIAIRLLPPGKFPNENLTGRKVASACAAVYGRSDKWLSWPDTANHTEWINRTAFAHLPIHDIMGDVYLQRAACAEGMGLTILPCFMADPYLERRSEPELASDIWLLVHPDLRRNPRLRLFRDEMAAALARHKDRLMGVYPLKGCVSDDAGERQGETKGA